MQDKTNLNLWIAALRSGEYEQGTSALCNLVRDYDQDDEPVVSAYFCCLGVLADVASKNGLDIKVSDGPYLRSYGDAVSYPTLSVVRWLYSAKEGTESTRNFSTNGGFDHMEGAMEWWAARGDTRSHDTLAAINDHEIGSFADIADFLEEFADKL